MSAPVSRGASRSRCCRIAPPASARRAGRGRRIGARRRRRAMPPPPARDQPGWPEERRDAAQPGRRANVRARREQHRVSAASPLVAAQCSAVMPSPWAALTSAPLLSSALTAAASRAFAASATAVARPATQRAGRRQLIADDASNPQLIEPSEALNVPSPDVTIAPRSDPSPWCCRRTD